MGFLNHKNNQEHTLPDVFTAAKHSVTARQVAEMYGIVVNSHGMACCPFHDDTHPSMKLDDFCYCFGCHASGDAIDFVSNLFQIGKREAALKIAEDFHISYDPKGRCPPARLVRAAPTRRWCGHTRDHPHTSGTPAPCRPRPATGCALLPHPAGGRCAGR